MGVGDGAINWLTKNLINGFLADIVKGTVEFVSQAIINIFDKDIEIMSTKEVDAAVLVTTGIASVLIIVLAFKSIFSTYVTETDGDPDADPLQVWVKVSIALALINGNNIIFAILQTLSKKFTEDLVGSIKVENFFNAVGKLLIAKVNLTPLTVIQDIVVFISVICVIILAFKAGIRAGELMLFKITFPIISLDKIGSNNERFNSFFSSYIVTFFGYSIQLFCLRLAINRALSGMSSGAFINYFAAFVLFYLAIKTPKWLEKFAYSSGLGQIASNGMRTAGFILPSLLRR